MTAYIDLPHPNWIILNSFFPCISGRRFLTKMDIKKFLCSGVRAVCLWNVLVNPFTKAIGFLFPSGVYPDLFWLKGRCLKEKNFYDVLRFKLSGEYGER